MKGIELPINILVVVAVAVIVLLGLVALYFTGWSPFGGAMSYQAVKNTACDELVRTGCGDPELVKTPNFDSDGNGVINTDDDLWDLCQNFFGSASKSDCASLCGCPVTG